ncbi:Transposase [Caligus rogercresseyi]|uniref:Transposase n=1 Tax=Caligus rogercresseyi TaxID=217165 RepID=A0A7T8HF40_CALRO|nr:Transposase [Caligus rogercresseyi]
MLLEAFGEHALGKTQCFEWFKRFKSGDFDVRNEERGRPTKKFEDADLQALLDEDKHNNWRITMGKIQKVGKWVPHQLNERQQENRKTSCEILQRGYIFM